ncbi:MAG: DNA internalization-related competence protein ComEC/Rec2 [Gammaproteobacteria bacterium]|nr:DNA internalization-related competence protein ComEC/Rec2 [Gammaproteobacteria bacterium]
MFEAGKFQVSSSLPKIALSLLLGVCFLQIQPDITVPVWSSAEMLILLPICLWFFYLLRNQRVFIAFLIGYLWALLFAQLYFLHQLPEELHGQNILLEGVVDNLPAINETSVRFNLKVKRYLSINGQKSDILPANLPDKVRLSWFHYKEEIHNGEHWQLLVRLKQPHGMFNPGGFDYEKWLYQENIQATGYIRKSHQNIKLSKKDNGINRLREKLQLILSDLPDSTYKGLLQALTIGQKSKISSEQWEVLRLTGTNHLMAISGLHIGLIAVMTFVLVSWLVPGFLCLYLSSSQIAALASLLVAGFYAMLAGFTVPTQRAFIMLLVMMLAILLKRPVFSLNTLALSLIAVLIINPVNVLSVGFWLSFIAVLIISLVSNSRVQVKQLHLNTLLQSIRVQWLIALGMLPLSVLLFQQGSLISPVANMLAIPLVGMLIVPLCLLASLISVVSLDLSVWVFTLTSDVLAYIWLILEWLSELPFNNWQRSTVPLLHSVLALIGVVILLLPKGLTVRFYGLFLLIPLLNYEYPKPQQGAFWIDVLDVGQGLSVLIRTREKSLLYDTGAKFSKNFDIGEKVVVPYLKYIGLNQLNTLMISHGDNDHAGGVKSVLNKLGTQSILGESSYIKKELSTYKTANFCKAGQKWTWNAVNFEVLHPVLSYKRLNNRSCVLKVWNQHYSLILPGDIESKAERDMLKNSADKLKTDILLVPHHGSNTSSSINWLEKTAPQVAIVSAGYRNRFGHPTDKVLKNYEIMTSRVLNTAISGMIQIKVPALQSAELIKTTQYRKVRTHYWNHRF